MEMALYEPGVGYYCSPRAPIGARGDYYTSPNAHPAFAALIALQLEQMWQVLGEPSRFSVVEMGGGKGLMAADVLSYASNLAPAFHQALEYLLIERDPRTEGLPPAIRAYEASDGDLPFSGVTGCFLSNEFFDALPVHRVVMSGGELREIYVAERGDGQMVEELGQPSTPELLEYFQWVGVSLPEGCQADINLAAPRWVARMADALERGYILTIDYGDIASRLFSAQHPRGTLMCYYRHTPTEDPYQHIGEQDITAHADFTALAKAGEGAGLATLGCVPQGLFLWNLGLSAFIEGVSHLGLPQAEAYANLLAMRDLARPDGLGGFPVLVQGKAAPDMPLHGLADSEDAHPNWTRVAQLPAPRLDQRHIPLLKARYPYMALDIGLPTE